ncbi:AAC(3) family N-acetyltransferase [Lactobacillus taiwanensis]|uniref:aminoglycoside N(3)-acetyltransferase n=1 Tax=Lactobacillus taiwanensis TaxID=508451 RepID=UPI000B99432D|nr:AAC(3) family N-acetyltransferase [Lactobacillus taiwanensis]OYS21910.1 AAC(3) family N-acetyltransferase [Lactobacillus taiwanensis]OYS23041.1 AAC(3) family N-acetyltransferase [Lactobacillus taiwanensis]OYS24722.1 AAC(3) family N-acetyltransferase [Lactobacillus taiwanensis]OYS26999.1 AAC(3) family N-acetyltransferase [Lactobacillus taiwanensis]OYS29606.1 AAC(3) family N-acetyltransferase [Lactobacillus taiwanensis]
MTQDIITTITTKDDFEKALIAANISSTDKVIVHTALSKFYYVPGGPESLVQALKGVITQGTIMMPSEVSTNCDPASWEYPPVRKDLIQVVRDNMPPYNPDTSPSEGLGITPEYFRKLPDVVRSPHPYLPIAIWGKDKDKIAKKQPLDLPYGINSPLDYLYQNNGKILFLGTNYETCTMLHYAESIIERKTETYTAATGTDPDGKTIWTNYQNIDMDIYDDFNDLGLAFETHNSSEFIQVNLNNGFIKAINVKPLVDFAKTWFRRKDNNL